MYKIGDKLLFSCKAEANENNFSFGKILSIEDYFSKDNKKAFRLYVRLESTNLCGWFTFFEDGSYYFDSWKLNFKCFSV